MKVIVILVLFQCKCCTLQKYIEWYCQRIIKREAFQHFENISKLRLDNVRYASTKPYPIIKSQDFHWISMVYWSLKRNKDKRSLYEDTKIICGKGQRVIFTHSAILITADNNLTNCIPLIKVWIDSFRDSKKIRKTNSEKIWLNF